jgi:hypothetical protein
LKINSAIFQLYQVLANYAIGTFLKGDKRKKEKIKQEQSKGSDIR